MIDKFIQRWREYAFSMKREAHAVYLASKDSRVPWYAKVVAVCVLAYPKAGNGRRPVGIERMLR
ncbi:MAG: hypothetical protein CXZ00_16595, partial [Acidobacteria bacterium]